MPCEKRPRSDSEADRYWRHIETTTIPISQDLRELIRADLKQYWYFRRLEKSRQRVKANWNTDDTQLVVLENETGTVTPSEILHFCNKATALYYLQTAHHHDAYGEKTLIPGMIFAMIAREWLQYHASKPNIEFGHYVANPIRVATGGPSDVQGIIQAHKSLCKQSAELMVKARQENLWIRLPRRANLNNYDIQPLYKAVILLVDRFDMDLEPDASGVFDLQKAIHRQSVLIARTGIEVGLSSQISFDSLKGKTLPLERSDLGMHPNVEVVRTSLANGIRFILDLERREFTAYPQNVHACGSDQSLNPASPTWAGKSEDASKDPDTWADALVEAGDMYGYDEDLSTWISIRRVQAAMIGENFADIIAVHGIETHSPKTWIAYERDEEPRGRAINWLCDEDMLPRVVPQARVWVYDYNSNCWSDQAGTVTLLAHGDVFLDLLWATMAMDQQIGRRPLIFIGSCFGGIVVAQALVRASEDQPRYASFLNSVIGVIFLGTPLRGTPVASMAQWVGLIHGFVGKETSDTVLMELEDRNDMLGHVIQDFAKMARLCKLEIRCFYETRRTQVLNAVAKRWIARLFPEINLVSKESACLDGYKHIALDARHAMMNKFRGPHDGRFILVSSSVKELADESRISRNRSIEELECIQAFASSYKGDKDRNPPRVQGICMWLLEHPKYISWCQEEYASLLWVTADPGCGKSVLARALVDEEHLMPRYETTSMCYFFFKDDDPARQTGANALSAILHQLFVQKPALLQHAIYDFRNNGGQLCNMFSTLWEILINAATDPNAGEIVCVLDALDETQESARGELLSYLSYFYASRDETMAKLYFLVTSRPYADIERGFCWGSAEGTEATCINLRGENESDQISKEIDIVIDDQLPRIANARRPRLDPEVLSRLTIHLKMTPHRTYLWLHLIFDIIRKSLDSTAPRLERLVNTLPRTVEEAYEKILNRSNHRKSARRLLHMVVGAIRPLTLRELNIACAIDELHESGEPCQRYSHLDLESEDALRAKARNVCGLFVIIVDSKIHLIHQTAKEFLLSQTSNDLAGVSQRDSDVWKHSLDQFDSQFIMLKICLSYLLLRELEHPVLLREVKDSCSDSQLQFADSAPSYFFLNYAAVAWTTHFRKSRSRDTGLLLQWVLDVCDTQSNRFQRWYHLYQSELGIWGVPRYSRDLSRLTVASYFGLRPIVEVLLKENGIDLNPRDESGNTPLGLAVYHGYFETVKLLAEQDDIDINAGMRDVGSPLYLAAKQNHLEIVKLLVEKDAIDLNESYGGTALETALMAGHYEVAKVLINKDSIERCFQVGDGDKELHYVMLRAIGSGDVELVELFIERKAFGINQKVRNGMTPLVMAIQDDKPAVVRLLVGKERIDLNLKGPKGRTPLAWAVRMGNAEMVDILLKKDGIEVNCKDAAGQTPLEIARSYPPDYGSDGYEVIDLLIEHNASDPTAPWLTKAWVKERRHARDQFDEERKD